MIKLTEIGTVRSNFKEKADPFEMRKYESRIILNPEYIEGLYRLSESSYIQIVFGFHLSEGFSLKHLRKQIIMKLVGRKYKNLYTSSLVSLSEGEKTEVDYLNGYLVDQGEKYNVDTPLNKFIVDLVHKIEDGKTKPSLSNLKLLEEKAKEVWNLK